MILGGYALHLYCDNYEAENSGVGNHDFPHEYDEFPHEYIAETGGACRKEARQAGWKFNIKTDRAICPKCVARGLKLETSND